MPRLFGIGRRATSLRSLPRLPPRPLHSGDTGVGGAVATRCRQGGPTPRSRTPKPWTSARRFVASAARKGSHPVARCRWPGPAEVVASVSAAAGAGRHDSGTRYRGQRPGRPPADGEVRRACFHRNPHLIPGNSQQMHQNFLSQNVVLVGRNQRRDLRVAKVP